MAPETRAEAERLILRGDDLDAVAEAVGVTRRTLERAFRAAHGVGPGRWRKDQIRAAAGIVKEPPPVSFRPSAADRAALGRVAKRDGVSLGEWARIAVAQALRHDDVLSALSGDED